MSLKLEIILKLILGMLLKVILFNNNNIELQKTFYFLVFS